eukprot:SAG31_NODE_30531_length_379_cov_2.196429_1_plen_56_part_10
MRIIENYNEMFEKILSQVGTAEAMEFLEGRVLSQTGVRKQWGRRLELIWSGEGREA